MRYRFRGLIRDTGKPVEGHVDADSEEFAFHLLANNGIVTESLRADPRPEEIRQAPPAAAKASLLPPLAMAMMGGTRPAAPPAPPAPPGATATAEAPASAPAGAGSAGAGFKMPPRDMSPLPGPPEMHGAIDSALNSSSSQIEFDALTQHFRGKKVWVIDRDKIKRNVARVVDQAITQSLRSSDNAEDIRKTVGDAIEKLFKDNRNITSPQGQAAPAAASGAGVVVNTKNLDAQIDRLSTVIKNFENSLASMQMAIRNMGSGGGGGGFVPRRNIGQAQGGPGLREEQNAVLMEIFKTNMDLLRNMEDEMRSANTAPEAAAPAAG